MLSNRRRRRAAVVNFASTAESRHDEGSSGCAESGEDGRVIAGAAIVRFYASLDLLYGDECPTLLLCRSARTAAACTGRASSLIVSSCVIIRLK